VHGVVKKCDSEREPAAHSSVHPVKLPMTDAMVAWTRGELVQRPRGHQTLVKASALWISPELFEVK
jgi:hypothetical protein